jgi:hypothetical protein
MLEKALMLLFALASIAVGVRSIITREARFSLSQRSRNNYGEDGDEQIVDGFPAILVGLLEIGVGIYVLVYRHAPW